MSADGVPAPPSGLSTGQVAERTGLSVHTLRFYERAGIPAEGTASRLWTASS